MRFLRLFGPADPLSLDCRAALAPVTVAYETYGTLSAAGDNAVFVCHALTGDSHVARHDAEDLPGWWDVMVGPGRPIDTGRYFVVCANVLGGCAGTTGAWAAGPDGLQYGLDFPPVSVADMVAVHRALLARLGVGRLHAVIGGSLGGMQVLEWLLRHPDDALRFVPIAASARQSADNLAWHAIGRAAIRADPAFADGRYPLGTAPRDGLGIARMIAHLTYLSERSLEEKFGRARRGGAQGGFGTPAVVTRGPFAVESYLEHQADKLVARFDANSYLYLTSAMDHFDAFARPHRRPRLAPPPRVHLVSFASDRLFGAEHSEAIARGLAGLGFEVSHYHETTSPAGHDAFLLNVPPYLREVADWLGEPAHASRPPTMTKS